MQERTPNLKCIHDFYYWDNIKVMVNHFNQCLFYGFLAAWLIVILYVVSIASRERKLRKELDRVKRLVEERELEQKRA